MSTDSALQPLQHLLQPAQPAGQIGLGHAAAGGTGGMRPFAIKLPAAAQLLPAKTTRALSIGGARRRRLLFAATACLFGIIVPSEIAYQSDMWVSRTIAGIPPHYALTAMVMLFAFANDSNLLKLLQRPAVVFYMVCLLAVVAVGFSRNGGNRNVVFADLYLIRWFFVGFMLMRLAIISGSLRQYLVVATIVTVATAMRIDTRNTMGLQLDGKMIRATSNDLWPVMNLATIMLGLLITVNWPRGFFHVAFCSSAFGMLSLLGGIRTSTRSLFIFQMACFLLSLVALSRDPRMRGKGVELRRAALILLLLGTAALAYLVATGQMLGNMTHIGQRFTEEVSERQSTSLARIREAADMLENLSPEEWIFGRGVGGMFLSTLGYWTHVPHIAVLGWLQKGGLFILFVALWALYLSPALSFFKALMVSRRTGPLPCPILVIGPPLMAWALLTFISGGIENGSSLGLGGLAALWLQLTDDDRQFAAARTNRPATSQRR
jgi:hypothetical protein